MENDAATQKELKGRRDLSTAENYYLWVACGGICSFEGCENRLIANSEGQLSNVGIKAHIIGHAKNSARHEYMEQYNFKQEELEDLKNLMLMCYEHSKIIDDKNTKEQFPPARLFDMKKKHEDMVRSWSDTKKKKSIALIHKRLGGPLKEFEVKGGAPYILLDAITDQEPFVDFSFEGWNEGKARNEELYERLNKKMKETDAEIGEIYSMSPIPLLTHLGSLLTDTIPLTIYQFDREEQLWVAANPNNSSDICLQTEYKFRDESDHLAILVSISGIVKEKDVLETLGIEDFDLLCFGIEDPGVKRILYKEDVLSVQRTIKEQVERLLQTKDYSKIHLFYAGPAGLAIEIGRGINTNIWPEVNLYEFKFRERPKYKYALTI